MFGASSLIVTMAAMAGGSILVSFLLVNLHGARSPMRPKNVVLLEIMIIFISFKDADLLHYLLPDVFYFSRQGGSVRSTPTRYEHAHAIVNSKIENR